MYAMTITVAGSRISLLDLSLMMVLVQYKTIGTVPCSSWIHWGALLLWIPGSLPPYLDPCRLLLRFPQNLALCNVPIADPTRGGCLGLYGFGSAILVFWTALFSGAFSTLPKCKYERRMTSVTRLTQGIYTRAQRISTTSPAFTDH